MNFAATRTDRPVAVVTGASSGIGLELAKQFARNGFDLVVAARSERIEGVAPELEALGAHVEVVRADLSTRAGNERLAAVTLAAGRVPDAVAINAGIGVDGDFTRETDIDAEVEMVELNVLGTLRLAKLLLPAMVERGAGRVLFTSSVASQLPASYMSVYGATKAFVHNFAQGVREELKDTGVTITTLVPGPTDTDFFRRADMRDTEVANGDLDDASGVAEQGFRALMKGDHSVVAGSFSNRAQVAMAGVLPEPMLARTHAKQAKPGTAD